MTFYSLSFGDDVFGGPQDIYRRVLDRTHKWWGEAADVLDDYTEPRDGLAAYIHRKMDMARENYFGSKVWTGEVIQGAPLLEPYVEGEVKPWMEAQIARIRHWISAGKLRPIEPFYLLLMIWTTTQKYADYEHQIAVLNGGRPLSDSQFTDAKTAVTGIILRGVAP
jgi:TetR/AcrR family transcriptional regulator